MDYTKNLLNFHKKKEIHGKLVLPCPYENGYTITIMAMNSNWREDKYTQIFNEELYALENRLKAGAAVTELEAVLRHLYILDGSDWIGRGEVQEITMAATIAAYECCIASAKEH
ncbi:MAG: hypothetical protein LBB43_02075 [Spirochaetaceae bacterium]|jgi:alpha-amylase/alpha-mannosidase (GH57 family)|nr:hypothetical protein [Spirochaetaceae bacterium]